MHISEIMAVVNGRITARAKGNGGSLTIKSRGSDSLLVLNNSLVDGRSGDRRLKVDIDERFTFLKSLDSKILADNPVLPVELDASGAFTTLSVDLADTRQVLDDACLRLVEGTGFSSFTVVGRSGTPPAPGGWTPSY